MPLPGSTRSGAPAMDPLSAALAAALRPVVAEAVRDALAEHAAGAAEPGGGAAAAPALLTNAQLAAALQISRASLHRLRDQGLPTVMVLDSPRYDLQQVRAWLDHRTREQRGEAAPHG